MLKSLIALSTAAAISLEACTVWILAPDSNETGQFVLHKTRDWGDGKEIPVTLLKPEFPDGKYKVLAFSPYMLFNEKGLGMVDTSTPMTTDETPGLEIINIGNTMNRVIHSCANVKEGLAMLEAFTKDGTNPKHDNYMLCDPNEAVIVELSPKHIAYRKVTQGFAVHTNHHIFSESFAISKGKLESNIKSATRMLITQDALARSLQEKGKITMEDTMALSRFRDDEKYPGICPFRNSTVCAADYIPDSDYPGLLGTIRICPGPPRYTIAIPVPIGINRIPEVLESGNFGKRSYEIKCNLPDDENALAQFQQMEQHFWSEYLEQHAEAKKLLGNNEKDKAMEMLQALFDKQVAEAYNLLKQLLDGKKPEGN